MLQAGPWRQDQSGTHKPVRVAMILSDGLGGRGGIARVAGYLMQALETRPDIHVSVVRARLTPNRFLKHLSIPLALARFARRCARDEFDVAHINIAPRGSTWRKRFYARVAQRHRIPVILHLHGSAYNEYYDSLSPRQAAAVREFFQSADTVVALSRFWREWMVGTLGLDPARVIEIPNGVPAPAASASTGRAVPRIVFLGELGLRKGVDVLLDALADLKSRGQAFEAVVGGNGEVAKFREAATRLGIAPHVAFPGWVGEAEVNAILREADLFVLPSRGENQPVSILEAMARGIPVVATDVGAIPEQVCDGETGVIVRPGDVKGLADALARLLAAPDLRREMGRKGMARFEQYFSADTLAARFAALYDRLGAHG